MVRSIQELRELQDRWLAYPLIEALIKESGEDVPVGDPRLPTPRELRVDVFPEWGDWFARWLHLADTLDTGDTQRGSPKRFEGYVHHKADSPET